MFDIYILQSDQKVPIVGNGNGLGNINNEKKVSALDDMSAKETPKEN